jgi:CubicO group peptidase (beta-lactamase class C family)
MGFRTVALIALVVAGTSFVGAQTAKPDVAERFRAAADYSRQMRGLSLLVIQKGKIVFEEYQNGFKETDTQMLASGTKSFSGVLLAAAIEDKLIAGFDEKVSETITEWKSDPRRSKITLRQLLSLTGGIDSGAIGRPPTYSAAVRSMSMFEPGEKFEYGPAPFQVFGEVMRRKLLSRKESVLDYLKRRIFDPIGLEVGSWTLQEGQPNLPSGAFLTAREWAKFGRFLVDGGKWDGRKVLAKKLLDELVTGSAANPNYGITFWLNRSGDSGARLAEKPRRRLQELLDIMPETDEISLKGFGNGIPRDMFVAAGAGKQRLYVIPSLRLVVVRQGRQSRFDDNEFLTRLLPAVR